ncbi:MAG TPA: carbon storage regulator CsrA [Chloroflexota bacterium]
MLVLSRKVDQTIVIQDNITIKILEINGDRVKLGINAPRDVVILRQELREEVHQENLRAARRESDAPAEAGALRALGERLAERRTGG